MTNRTAPFSPDRSRWLLMLPLLLGALLLASCDWSVAFGDDDEDEDDEDDLTLV